jgi:hypothetical protein
VLTTIAMATDKADSAISYIAGERTPRKTPLRVPYCWMTSLPERTPKKTPPLLRGCVLLRVYPLPKQRLSTHATLPTAYTSHYSKHFCSYHYYNKHINEIFHFLYPSSAEVKNVLQYILSSSFTYVPYPV